VIRLAAVRSYRAAGARTWSAYCSPPSADLDREKIGNAHAQCDKELYCQLICKGKMVHAHAQSDKKLYSLIASIQLICKGRWFMRMRRVIQNFTRLLPVVS
jgi:hypothetical protein